MTHTPSAIRPACPRCDYDLSGSVATWERAASTPGASCPIEGLCPECGLRFAWADVMRPDRVTPRWSFEHAPAGAGMLANISRLARTVARLLLPRRLWMTMPLAAPVHRGRAAIVGLVGLLPGYVLGGIAFVGMLSTGWLLGWWAEGFPPLDARQRGARYVPNLFRHLQSLRDNWFVHWHFDRASPSAPASFECPNLVGWLWPLLIGPCFLLLPQTMRQVRVSRRHIWRASLYGIWLVPLAGVGAASYIFVSHSFRSAATRWFSSRLPEWFAESAGRAGLILTFLLLWFWWSAVTTRYLRLPHGRSVAFALVLIGFLVSMVVLYALPPTRPSVMLYMQWNFLSWRT